MRTLLRALPPTLTVLAFTAPVSADAQVAALPEVRSAVEKALPLLAKGAAGHIAQKVCFACHNQSIPILALTTAKSRGFAVSDEDLARQMAFTARFLDRNRANYLQGRGQGGQVDTAGYALLTLELGRWKPDATTAAVAEYLLRYNRDSNHWRVTANRPPSEVSQFTANFLAIRALKTFGTAEQQERIRERLEEVRPWLQKTAARDTEDRVFRLWALQVAEASAEDVQLAVEELVRTQRKDGGWGQTGTMASDAYATGSVLTVLHQAGGLKTTDPVYQRGVRFLLQTQLLDGSWLVRSRSRPFQTYYESGFPHGKDQFISAAASGWAATALALACPPPPKRPDAAPR